MSTNLTATPRSTPCARAHPPGTSNTNCESSVGAARLQRQRLGVLLDVDDVPVGPDEDHVERDVRVLHPELQPLRMIEQEDHAAARRQRLPIHEAVLPLGVGARDLDLDVLLAGARHRAPPRARRAPASAPASSGCTRPSSRPTTTRSSILTPMVYQESGMVLCISSAPARAIPGSSPCAPSRRSDAPTWSSPIAWSPTRSSRATRRRPPS